MIKFSSFVILAVVYSCIQAEPVVHTLRLRLSEPVKTRIVSQKLIAHKNAPYAPAGLKPEPAFELPLVEPELTYGPPAPEATYGTPFETYGPPPDAPPATYGPPEETYGPPDETYLPPDQTYGPPDQTYGPPEIPDLIYGPPENFEPQTAAIVNSPLLLSSQFTPPRPNKPVSFRPNQIKFPQPAAVVNAPLRPQTQRPRIPQSHHLFPQTHLTLPRVERLNVFRPRRIPSQQPTKFSRPLPANIFATPNQGRSSRPLPSKIFPN